MKRIIVGLTGASGTVYGTRLVEVLADQTNFEVHLTISPAGARSLLEEVGIDIDVDNFELYILTYIHYFNIQFCKLYIIILDLFQVSSVLKI